MKLPSRVGAFIVLLSCVTAPVVAEVPPSSPSAQPAPLPPPSATPASLNDTTAPAAPIDPAKEAEIRKLLNTTGTVKLVNQMLQQMLGTFRDRASGLPPEFWDQLQKEMDPTKLVDKLIPVYDKYYTLEDLKAVNAFYQTPAGQHLLQVQPQILKESMGIGQQWGREAGMKAMLEIENYKQKMSTTPPSGSTAPSAPAPSAKP
ncbi:MAG TPA: DUF2059 domain-containing protein [Candidatus Methylacidiphilales bacterium]|jgi:hypothetical protein|nr:DUF2059 domain-containing protein [Candidatus Methylacidiphilales bacterium]